MKPATPKAIYTIDQLEAITRVPRRTIRHWIHIKLLQRSYPPEYPDQWKAPRYGAEHVRRIEKLKRFKEYKPTNRDLAERLELVGDKALDVPDIYNNE